MDLNCCVCVFETSDHGDSFQLVQVNDAAKEWMEHGWEASTSGSLPLDEFVVRNRELLHEAWAADKSIDQQDNLEGDPLLAGFDWIRLSRLPSGRLVLMFNSLSKQKMAEDGETVQAQLDALTRLPDRRQLFIRLQQALAASQRNRQHGALLFLDMDNFKTLNDTWGHQAGDSLLIEVAARLTAVVREVDMVARFGGDEFVVLVESLSEVGETAALQCEEIARKILASLNQPYQFPSFEYWCGASVGIAMFLGKETTVVELLKRADIAMYQAKAAGKNNLRFFDPAMQAAVAERAYWESELLRAIEQREFKLRFQPEIDKNNRVVAIEALVYWQHPERGVLNAADFVPLAEETGLIRQLGQQVLELACWQLAEWAKHKNTRHLTLSVNISVKQFHQYDFIDQVKRALADTSADPHLLRLELTESILFFDQESARKKMIRLDDLGVRFSLDDFGTGYSSLAHFKKLPLDQVKIDKTLVHNLVNDPFDKAFARSVISLGELFGVSVVAEGVETDDQRNFLVKEGCAALQGNLFGSPVPLDKLMETYFPGADD